MTSDSIKAFSSAQTRLLPEVREKCQMFLREELARILEILGQQQRELFRELFEDDSFLSMPELVASQAALIESEEISRSSGRYSIWGSKSNFVLEYDGTFSLQIKELNSLSLDYFVNALHKNKRTQRQLNLVDYQIEELGETVREINELNENVGVLLDESQSKNEEENVIAKWNRDKKELVSKSLDSILLDIQKSKIDELNSRIEVRRFGLHWALVKGSLGKILELSQKQKSQIQSSATKLSDRYSKFSKQTTQWYLEQLCSKVQDKNDRGQIKELFEHDFKFLRLPLGSLSRGLIR